MYTTSVGLLWTKCHALPELEWLSYELVKYLSSVHVTRSGIADVIIAFRLTVQICRNSSGLPPSWFEVDRRRRHQSRQSGKHYIQILSTSTSLKVHWIPRPGGRGRVKFARLTFTCRPVPVDRILLLLPLLLFSTRPTSTLQAGLRSESDHGQSVIHYLPSLAVLLGWLRFSNRLPSADVTLQ